MQLQASFHFASRLEHSLCHRQCHRGVDLNQVASKGTELADRLSLERRQHRSGDRRAHLTLNESVRPIDAQEQRAYAILTRSAHKPER